eukprot:162203_1
MGELLSDYIYDDLITRSKTYFNIDDECVLYYKCQNKKIDIDDADELNEALEEIGSGKTFNMYLGVMNNNNCKKRKHNDNDSNKSDASTKKRKINDDSDCKDNDNTIYNNSNNSNNNNNYNTKSLQHQHYNNHNNNPHQYPNAYPYPYPYPYPHPPYAPYSSYSPYTHTSYAHPYSNTSPYQLYQPPQPPQPYTISSVHNMPPLQKPVNDTNNSNQFGNNSGTILFKNEGDANIARSLNINHYNNCDDTQFWAMVDECGENKQYFVTARLAYLNKSSHIANIYSTKRLYELVFKYNIRGLVYLLYKKTPKKDYRQLIYDILHQEYEDKLK